MLFTDLNLSIPIQKALKEAEYSYATPIQEQSIPILLEGKDLLGCAQTGTGKTAAFALPILEALSQTQTFSGKRKIRYTFPIEKGWRNMYGRKNGRADRRDFKRT